MAKHKLKRHMKTKMAKCKSIELNVSYNRTRSYTQNKSLAGSSLPAETKPLRTDGLTDGPTHPFLELWLTTVKKGEKGIYIFLYVYYAGQITLFPLF